jgi:hypothetical protein
MRERRSVTLPKGGTSPGNQITKRTSRDFPFIPAKFLRALVFSGGRVYFAMKQPSRRTALLMRRF